MVCAVPLPIDVVLVRHGESEGNEATRRARTGDTSQLKALRSRHSSFWRLTDRGIEQARRAGAWLRAAFPGGFDGCFTSQLEFARWYTDPDRRIANGEIFHYSRRDPRTGELSEHLVWRRRILPGDGARSHPWEPISRRRYDSAGLLQAAEEEWKG
jgi:hypothetical protein